MTEIQASPEDVQVLQWCPWCEQPLVTQTMEEGTAVTKIRMPDGYDLEANLRREGPVLVNRVECKECGTHTVLRIHVGDETMRYANNADSFESKVESLI